MASRIAGITIEIDGDTTKLQKSLKGVDSDLKATSAKLRDVEKLLKLDPKNTELLRQKQQALSDSIEKQKSGFPLLKTHSLSLQKAVKNGILFSVRSLPLSRILITWNVITETLAVLLNSR